MIILRHTLALWSHAVVLAFFAFHGVAPAIGADAPRRCPQTEASTFAFVGDLIFQGDLQTSALAPGSSYRRFWEASEAVLHAVDGVYGNLEGTLSQNITYRGEVVTDTSSPLLADVHSSPPDQLNFNYHPRLASELRASGFRVISTANNHALDRGSMGVDQTIEQLEGNGITPVGTRHSRASAFDWGRVTQVGDFNIGWVACTFGTNGYPDTNDQVLECYSERDQVLAAIRTLAARSDVDAVFFVPHWGIEDQLVVARRQLALAREVVEAGATAIVGTHPHILQEWEWVQPPGGIPALVVYSTGNFVSAQQLPHQRAGMILLITIERPAPPRRVQLKSSRYLLTEFVWPPGRITIVPYDAERHSILPQKAYLSEVDLASLKHQCD